MNTWGEQQRQAPTHYPRPPRRPQARRGRASGVCHGRAGHGSVNRLSCLMALILVAATSVAVVHARTHQHPSAAGTGAAPPAPPFDSRRLVPALDESIRVAPPTNEAALPRAALAATTPSSPAAMVRGGPAATRRLVAELTAYSATEDEGTAWGITRSGTPARHGTVAVDPTVIPLGSRLWIAGLPDVYRAEDTGGGIHGAHVDMFMESAAAALAFGRRSGVLVDVLAPSP